MNLFGLSITRTKASSILAPPESRGSWWPIVRESYAGAWQQDVEVSLADVLTHPTVYACITLIASDVAKMRLRLVEADDNDIWTETENPAYSPVLREPNHYQTPFEFFESWMLSKLIHGNTYVLKERDNRGVVTSLYVLDPQRVRPLIAPDGDVFYEVKRDDLSGQPQDVITVPQREVIHDRMAPLFHPLVGKSPLWASGVAAMLGIRILNNSANFFANGSNPGGVLVAPGAISDATAARLKAYWDANYTGSNVGKVAVLGDGLKYEPMAVHAQDSQLTEQWGKVSEAIASTFHVPYHLVGGSPPPYNNIQALTVQYFTQCIHAHSLKIEQRMDKGLELKKPLGTEFNVDDLLWMDSATMMQTMSYGVKSGVLAPNEARAKLNLKPVEGGDTPYLQQQNFSLAALDEREDQAVIAAPVPPPALPAMPEMPEIPMPGAEPAEAEAKEWDGEFLEALSFGLTTKHIEQVRAA